MSSAGYVRCRIRSPVRGRAPFVVRSRALDTESRTGSRAGKKPRTGPFTQYGVTRRAQYQRGTTALIGFPVLFCPRLAGISLALFAHHPVVDLK